MDSHPGAAARLPDQEQLYRSVVSAMQEGVVVQDADGRIIACNASAERILGLTADQLMGLTAMDPRWRAVDADGVPINSQQHPSVLTRRTGQPQSDVVMGVHKPDGSLAWVLVNSRPVPSEDGSLPCPVVVTFADITARRLAEGALRESEQRFRLLFESSLDAILLTRPDGAILAANPAACRMFGRTEAELRQIGRQGVVDPDDERLPAALAERALTGGFRGELTHVRADGTRFPAEICTAVFTVAGADVQTSVFVRDLSERERVAAARRQHLALQQQTVRLNQLVRASRLFAEAVTDTRYLLTLIAEHAAELTGDACTVRLLSEDGAHLRPAAVHHADAQLREAMWRAMEQTTERADIGLWRAAIEEQRVARVAVAGSVPPGASGAQVEFLRRYPVREIMGVPLIARGRVLGGMSLVRLNDEEPFTSLDESFLHLLAERAALAIDNARLYDEARTQLETWRALVENAPDIISRFDRDLRHLYVNPAGEGAVGMPASAMVGKTNRELGIPEPLVTTWEVALRGVFERGRERTLELTHTTPMGERHYQARIAPEFGPDGSVQTALVVSRDITDRRKTDLERDELYRELLGRDRRLQDLVGRLLLDRESERRRAAATSALQPITPREAEVLRLVAKGLTNQQVGRQLGLSSGTVKNHIARLVEKLRAPDRTAAVARAIHLGLIELE